MNQGMKKASMILSHGMPSKYTYKNLIFSGNKAKIDRAKKWKHWFIHDDFTCDMDLVNNTVY